MDPYSNLRRQVTQKRDTAIVSAQAEYHDAVNAIERLCAYLGDPDLAPKQKRFKPLLEAMADAIPQEGVFTFEELLQRMAVNEPARALNSASVRSLLPQLQKQGIIRRVSKNQAGRVEWAAAGADVPDSPYGAMALTDVAESVLREHGAMRPVELVVAIRESGYRADANPQKMLGALRNMVRRYPERFLTNEEGRWNTVTA